MKSYAINPQPTSRGYLISGLMLITLLLLSSLLIPSTTMAKTISSGSDKVAMLELYTSQGCSSCPPAEKWIAKFKDDPKLWHLIVPVNFHVDYWDYLGWKDPYAKNLFTARQRSYKQLKHALTVATPGFIVNGKGWNGWFYKLNYPRSKPRQVGAITAEITKLTQPAKVTFTPNKKITEKLEIHVAILGFDLVTNITRGENKGKKLKHDFVVLGYHHQNLSLDDNIATTQLSLPDVTAFNANRQAIVFWVSTTGDPTPIQVAADWL